MAKSRAMLTNAERQRGPRNEFVQRNMAINRRARLGYPPNAASVVESVLPDRTQRRAHSPHGSRWTAFSVTMKERLRTASLICESRNESQRILIGCSGFPIGKISNPCFEIRWESDDSDAVSMFIAGKNAARICGRISNYLRHIYPLESAK